MYIGQVGTISVIVEEALRTAIKKIAVEPKLNDVSSNVLARAIVAQIVQMAQVDDIEALIVIGRTEATK